MKEGFKLKKLEEGNLIPSHSYQLDAIVRKRCPEHGERSHVRGRAPEEQHKGIPATRSASWGAQLKCLYANTGSVGSKQEEFRDVHTPAGLSSH